jgi:serine/threonine protein kinase/Tfp pilus assembly protein PilF
MTLHPGARFGRYELISRLGRGGMAETYRARLLGEAGVTKLVLIKKILPEYANDQAFTHMFVSEARISATLSHGNVAQVYDFGRVDGEYFLAMEFVDGQPLNRVIKRALKSGLPSIPVSLATFIALEMCRGLHYAHTRKDDSGKSLGIVHRDISPDNVLVSYEGQVKIVDFGIAKARELRGFNTEPGIVKGKYLFFSPEQARGEQVDARTDVWATGIVLYEMLCGQLPVTGPQYVAVPRLINGEFPRPRGLNPEIPEELDGIVMDALALDREQRIGSCHELGDALAGFLYSSEPRFSAMSVAHLVQELFREDLTSAGRSVQVPASFLEQLAVWKGSEVRTVPLEPPKARTTPLESPRAPEPRPARPPASSPRTALMWGVGLGVVLAGTVLALAFSFMSEPPPPPEATSLRKLGPPSRVESIPARPSLPTPAPAPERVTPTAAPERAPSPPPAAVAVTRSALPTLQLPLPALTPSKSTFANYERAEELADSASRYLAGARYAEAEALAEQCLQLDKQHAVCYEHLSTAAHFQNKPDEAVKAYRTYLRLALPAKEAQSDWVKKRLQWLGSPPSAVSQEVPPSEDSFTDAPEAPSASEQAKTAFEDAANLLKKKQYVEARMRAKSCIELEPGNAECHLVLGSSHAGLSEWETAAQYYRKFLELAPDHKTAPKVRMNLENYEKSKPR